MSDSEYDSEEDEDYIPEESASEEETEVFGEGKVNRRGKKRTKQQGKVVKRKRKGGIQLEGEEARDFSNGEEDEEFCEDLEHEAQEQHRQEELSKSKVEDLWTAFKEDTAAVRPSSKDNLKSKTTSDTDIAILNVKDLNNKAVINPKASITSKAKSEKVEVTEIFDFAGEEVRVVKSVDASALKGGASSNNESKSGDSKESKSIKSQFVVPRKRSSGGLGSVLGKIGKKPKLSTLEKSKLDWNSFKREEGIEDDLKTSNRDGYLEKQAFLNRVDQKQFEIERDVRQGVRKR